MCLLFISVLFLTLYQWCISDHSTKKERRYKNRVIYDLVILRTFHRPFHNSRLTLHTKHAICMKKATPFLIWWIRLFVRRIIKDTIGLPELKCLPTVYSPSTETFGIAIKTIIKWKICTLNVTLSGPGVSHKMTWRAWLQQNASTQCNWLGHV